MSYIEREAILKYSRAMLDRAAHHIRTGQTESDTWKAIHHTQQEERAEFVSLLENAPAADVAEVRHGRWERVSTASGIISRVRCSVCAGTQPLTFENMPYCPTCGARMDEEDGHEIS